MFTFKGKENVVTEVAKKLNVVHVLEGAEAQRGRHFSKGFVRERPIPIAGILTGLSDGKDGHPIKRGVWLLRNLLDENRNA